MNILKRKRRRTSVPTPSSEMTLEEMALLLTKDEEEEKERAGFFRRFFGRIVDFLGSGVCDAIAIIVFFIADFTMVAAATTESSVVAIAGGIALVIVFIAIVNYASYHGGEKKNQSASLTLLSWISLILIGTSLGLSVGLWGWIVLGGIIVSPFVLGTVLARKKWRKRRKPRPLPSPEEAVKRIEEWVKKKEEAESERIVAPEAKLVSLQKEIEDARAQQNAHKKSPLLQKKYGEYIAGNLALLNERHESVTKLITALQNRKEKMREATTEFIQNLLPSYALEKAFLNDSIALDRLIARTDEEIGQANALFRESGIRFVETLSRLRGIFEAGSAINQALTEVTAENVTERAPLLLEEYLSDEELDEVIRSVKTHA